MGLKKLMFAFNFNVTESDNDAAASHIANDDDHTFDPVPVQTLGEFCSPSPSTLIT